MTVFVRAVLPALCLCLAWPAASNGRANIRAPSALGNPLHSSRLSPSEDRTDHSCIRGDYPYVYATGDGLYGQSEV